MMKDPVCGMQVDENKSTVTSGYNGKTYFFCSTECEAEFDKNPESSHSRTSKEFRRKYTACREKV